MMMTERTTNLDLLKSGTPFSWGEFSKIHTIGEYDIVEFHPFKRNGARITSQPDFGTVNFHGYLNGKDVSQSWRSIDAALVGLIAYNHDGANSQAGYYFMKMIDPE